MRGQRERKNHHGKDKTSRSFEGKSPTSHQRQENKSMFDDNNNFIHEYITIHSIHNNKRKRCSQFL